jgi:hypothetical protein
VKLRLKPSRRSWCQLSTSNTNSSRSRAACICGILPATPRTKRGAAGLRPGCRQVADGRRVPGARHVSRHLWARAPRSGFHPRAGRSRSAPTAFARDTPVVSELALRRGDGGDGGNGVHKRRNGVNGGRTERHNLSDGPSPRAASAGRPAARRPSGRRIVAGDNPQSVDSQFCWPLGIDWSLSR